MMKKINSKLIIELIIIATLLLALTTVAFAADPIIVGNPTSNTQNNAGTQNEVPNVIDTNSNYNTSNTSYRANTNTNTNNTLPQTGVTDGYVVAILVTVCAVSAIYAYKKIRDYNVR